MRRVRIVKRYLLFLEINNFRPKNRHDRDEVGALTKGGRAGRERGTGKRDMNDTKESGTGFGAAEGGER